MIVLNEMPLTEVFIPTRLLHRDGQLREVERCLKPFLAGRAPENLFLVGPTGTGKTTVARWMLETHFHGRYVYVNCWKYRRSHQVLREILLSFEVPVHGREPTSELIRMLERLLESKRLIVCLDEVDQLKDYDALYMLARHECCLILISNDYRALSYLDPRIRSRLSLVEVEFPAYRYDELVDILRDRVRLALRPGSLDERFLRIIAAIAKGDARTGIEILRRAARRAEDRGLRRITLNEIKEAIKEARRLRKSYLLSKLNEHQRVIYSILEAKRSMGSGELYRKYCSKVKRPVTDRAFRNYMKKLVRLGLVAEQGYGRWRKYEVVI